MIQYVLGFCFSPDYKSVALIHKKKPEWQLGKINGIGGKLEENELPHEAMIREFQEETGLVVLDWECYAVMTSSSWECYCHRAISSNVFDVRTMTEEDVILRDPLNLPSIVIPNLRWLVPLAMDTDLKAMTEVYYS
jgi:8-oxo-dGTP diphosphatase